MRPGWDFSKTAALSTRSKRLLLTLVPRVVGGDVYKRQKAGFAGYGGDGGSAVGLFGNGGAGGIGGAATLSLIHI